jgi:spermidine synthase
VDFKSAIALLRRYDGRAADLEPWLAQAEINRDRNLRLQYLAGLSLNSNMGHRILSSILAHYRFPERIFVGSPEGLEALKRALARGGRKPTDGPAMDQNGSNEP